MRSYTQSGATTHPTYRDTPIRVCLFRGVASSSHIAHLVGLVGASVRVTLEIEADIPNGAVENVVRIVTENSRTLKFDQAGFELE